MEDFMEELINKMAEAAHNEIKTIDVVKKALAAIQEDYVLVRKDAVEIEEREPQVGNSYLYVSEEGRLEGKLLKIVGNKYTFTKGLGHNPRECTVPLKDILKSLNGYTIYQKSTINKKDIVG